MAHSSRVFGGLGALADGTERQILPFSPEDELSLPRRQKVYGELEKISPLLLPETLTRRRHVEGRELSLRERLLAAAVATSCGESIVLAADHVLHDPAEQGAKVHRIRDGEARAISKELDHGLLNDVVGLRLGAQLRTEALSNAPFDRRQIPLDESIQSLAVTAVSASQELSGLRRV